MIRAQSGFRVRAQSARSKARFRAQLGGGQSRNPVWLHLGFSLRLESNKSLGSGSGPSRAKTQGQSSHGAQHTQWFGLQPRPQHLPLGSASGPPPGASSPSLPTGTPTFPFMGTPSWPCGKDPLVHLSAELSWEPSSANGPEPVSLRSLPPDCWRSRLCHAASELGSHCRVQTPSTAQFQPTTKHFPDGQGPHCACLPPASGTAHSLPGAQGKAHCPGSQPWVPGRAGEGQGPRYHLPSGSLQPYPRSR